MPNDEEQALHTERGGLVYKCECGNLPTLSPTRCLCCSKCVKFIEEKAPEHAWYITQVETDEGMKPFTRCKCCQKTKREVEKGNQDD